MLAFSILDEAQTLAFDCCRWSSIRNKDDEGAWSAQQAIVPAHQPLFIIHNDRTQRLCISAPSDTKTMQEKGLLSGHVSITSTAN